MTNKTKVLFASAEVAPFAKVGGLGDVSGALPIALNGLESESFDLRIFMPFHARVREYNPPHHLIGSFNFKLTNDTNLQCELYLSQ
ncbi:MAG TPA: glycogen/starch synthase, partial [Anaerolineaceae bacterium]|nr:glycogen/starch synthase [Anaerolineaceae bacterium]